MKLGQDEDPKNPSCWNRDTQVHSLRVELADGSFYVFPYNHLAFVRFESGNENDTIHVSLDAHEIQIVGKNLRGLGLAFQKFTVDWVKELPARYNPLASDDHACIRSITVNDTQQ